MAGFLTQVGLAKINVASPLQPLTIKSMAIGSGTDAYNDSILRLQDQKWIGDATAPIKKDGGLEFSANLPANVGGFNITEIGLIDSEGDLIAYERLDSPINKPIGLMKLTPYMLLILNNSESLNLIITDEVNFRHNGMTARDVADCHPISSITGLTKAIGLKSNKITASKVLTADDYGAFDVDASFGNIVITMPDVSLVASSNYVFTRTDSTANTVFFQPFGTNKFIAEGISGATSRLLQYETSWFKKLDSNNWVGGRSVQEQLTTISGKPWLITKGVGISRFLMESNVVNALNSIDTLNPLSAAQGKALNDAKIDISSIVNNITSTSTVSPLSANMGRNLASRDLGWEQTYKIPSRISGTSYTNTTGKPLLVIVNTYAGTAYVDGVQLRYKGDDTEGDWSFIVPVNSVYSCNGSIRSWVELS